MRPYRAVTTMIINLRFSSNASSGSGLGPWLLSVIYPALRATAVAIIVVLAILTTEGLAVLNGLSGQRIHAVNNDGEQTEVLGTIPLSELNHVVVLAVGTDYRIRDVYNPKPFPETTAEDLRSRSDVIILFIIDREKGRIAAISIPRDTLTQIPGRGRDRINHSFMFGGICLLKKTIETSLSIPIHRIAIVDFEGFANLIDAIGGVTIIIEEDLLQPGGRPWLPAGTHRLNGAEALRFARHRYKDPRADLGRIERQQHLLRQMAAEIRAGGYPTIYKVVREAPNHFKTNFTVPEMFHLYSEFRGFDLDSVEFYRAPGRAKGGYWIDMDQLRPIIREFYPDYGG